MAMCPNCRGRMGQTDVICPNCGHDFRQSSPPVSRGVGRGRFASSGLATLALSVGQLISALGCIVAVIAFAIAIVQGQWLLALVAAPISFLYSLAMLIVFTRVQNLG